MITSRWKGLAVLLTFAISSIGVTGATEANASRSSHKPRVARIAQAAHEKDDTLLGTTTTFKYKQRKLLFSRNGAGGLAYVPGRADRSRPLPIVVFLHGLNADEQMHPWLNGREGDLRILADHLVESGLVESFVLAAPTHTRFATGTKSMWPDFDLADFVHETANALNGHAQIDASRIILIGHSAAGCNVGGGILGPKVRTSGLLANVVVDTCMKPEIEAALAAQTESTQLRIYWQPSWERSFDELRASCDAHPRACKVEEIDAPGKVPHNTILPLAITRALTEFLPAQKGPSL